MRNGANRSTGADRDANLAAVARAADSRSQMWEPGPHHRVQKREPDTAVQCGLQLYSTDADLAAYRYSMTDGYAQGNTDSTASTTNSHSEDSATDSDDATDGGVGP